MALATIDVELAVLSGHKFTTPHTFTPILKKLRYKVVLYVQNVGEGAGEGATKVRGVAENSSIVWNSKIGFCGVSDTHTFELELFCHHRRRKSHRVGRSKTQSILSLKRSQANEIQLYSERGEECGVIMVGLRIPVVIRKDTSSETDVASRYSVNRLQNLDLIGSAINNFSTAQQISPAWADLLFSLSGLVRLANGIAQIDPIARLAVTAITFAFEVTVQQCERAKRIDSLVETMASIYDLIARAEPLDQSAFFVTTLDRLLKKTHDCALFVVEYCRNQSFALKVIQGIASGDDELIESFERAFIELRIEFITKLCLKETMLTIRILEKVEDIARIVLDIGVAANLPINCGTSWRSLKRCFADSQSRILMEISRWAVLQDPHEPIQLLVGPQGSGKTCIAASTAANFHSVGQLGASIFLDRDKDKDEHRDLNWVFLSIARELASFDRKLQARIFNVISSQPDLLRSAPEQQFQELIINPLRNLTVIGPILIVIDGLDVRQTGYSDVVSTIKNARTIPKNLRILITARHEEPIVHGLTDIAHCYLRTMTTNDEGVVDNVSNYTCQCLEILQDVRQSIFAYISLEVVLGAFTSKSGGIYLWLAVAIRFLSIASDESVQPFLSEILAIDTSPKCPDRMQILKDIIRRVLIAKSPIRLRSRLSVGGSAALRVMGLCSDKTDEVLEKLSARGLLQADDVSSKYLSTIIHPGSRWAGKDDGIRCSHGILQDAGNARTCMAHVCLDFLCNHLTSDICTRSYLAVYSDGAVIDPRPVLKQPGHGRLHIDEAYRYACESWIPHLEDVQDCCNFVLLKSKLLNFSRHFFHLFEFMRRDKTEMISVLTKFHKTLQSPQLHTSELVTLVDNFRSRLKLESLDVPGDRDNDSKYWVLVKDSVIAESCCDCPLYRAWKISNNNTCFLNMELKYKETISDPLCLAVTPAVLAMAIADGQICRTIKQIELVVRRDFINDKNQHSSSSDIEIGVAIARPQHGILPVWAGNPNAPYSVRGAVYQMKEPWLCPQPGEQLSKVVPWEGEQFRYEANQGILCPLHPGDRLGVIARLKNSCGQFPVRFSVTINLVYESGGEK